MSYTHDVPTLVCGGFNSPWRQLDNAVMSLKDKANPVSGVMEWVYFQDDDDAGEDDVKHEIARSTYAGMLHDTERNNRYYEAIKKAVERIKMSGIEANVLDIGTGTGILSMMAAVSGASVVTACEVFKPMAQIAIKVIEENGFSNKITVVGKRSTDLLVGKGKDLQEKVNLLVTEIFDSELIGEGVLPTIRHARRNLLQEQCKIIPSSARVYIQFAECDSLWRRHKLSRLKFPNAKPIKLLQSLEECQGTAAVDELHIDAVNDIKMLSSQVEAIRFDFNGCLDNLSFEKRREEFNPVVNICTTGTLHCLIVWWDLTLDEEEKIILSMAPKIASQHPDKVLWRDHWMQAVYFLSSELDVTAGDNFEVSVYFDDYSFWFDINDHSSRISKAVRTNTVRTKAIRPICTCGFHIVWSRERFSMCNNLSIWDKYCLVIEKLKTKNKAVVLGDVSLLPLFAAQYFDKVIYIEFSQMSKDLVKKMAAHNKVLNKIDIINIRDVNSKDFTNLFSASEPDAILAEPFFSTSLLPWEHLTFWYHHETISKQLKTQPLVIPGKGILRLAAVQFQDLWKVRKPVNMIGEFQLGSFDAVIKAALRPENSDAHGLLFEAEPYAVWEYKCEMLSDCIPCGCFDFNRGFLDEDCIKFEGKLIFNGNGVFHALVAWMDFCLDDESVWTTGYDPKSSCWVNHSKQGVVFLENPEKVEVGGTTSYRILFQKNSCKLLFQLRPGGG